MTSLPLGNSTANCSLLCERGPISLMSILALPSTQLKVRAFGGFPRGRAATHSLCQKETSLLWGKTSDRINNMVSKKVIFTITRSSGSSNSNGEENSPDKGKPQKSFGYSRKDVILIGVGVTALGVGLKSGLELAGVDPLQAGNVVQLLLVLGLILGWISTYIFRVGNKQMTYAQQLRDYESAVMEKRIEGLTEAELEVLLEQVDEEKTRLNEKVN